MARKVDVGQLRDDAAEALERGKLGKAIELYEQLEDTEPDSPAWSKKVGETYRRAGDNAAAVAAFERAADKYALSGFLVQAIAVCKLILQIDPHHSATQARLAGLLAPSTPRQSSPTFGDDPPHSAPRTNPRAQTAPATPTARTSTRERDLAAEAARAQQEAGVRIATPRAPTPAASQARAREPSLPAVIVDKKPIAIDIPPGGGLDQVDLTTLLPSAVPVMLEDGRFSGVNVLPLDEGVVEISIDDVEITNRVPGIAARRALLTTPLFPHVSPRVLERLIVDMSLRELRPDEVLFREGETGDELFVISEGEVAVETQGIGELARLGPSAFFGEIALVTDLPRSATIRAVGNVELLAIDRGVIREASKQHPEIVTVLLRFVRDRLIDRITRTSELFRPFTDEERRSLSARFELVEVVPDAVLITQGERADGLYLVVAGKVEVWRDGEGALATLGSGDVFGELSLLAGGGSTANVRATTRVIALRMPASTFQEVIMTHPQVLAYLGELAARRTPSARAASQFADLHIDMLV